MCWAVISVRMSIWCMIDVTISGSERARVVAVCLTCGCIVAVRSNCVYEL